MNLEIDAIDANDANDGAESIVNPQVYKKLKSDIAQFCINNVKAQYDRSMKVFAKQDQEAGARLVEYLFYFKNGLASIPFVNEFGDYSGRPLKAFEQLCFFYFQGGELSTVMQLASMMSCLQQVMAKTSVFGKNFEVATIYVLYYTNHAEFMYTFTQGGTIYSGSAGVKHYAGSGEDLIQKVILPASPACFDGERCRNAQCITHAFRNKGNKDGICFYSGTPNIHNAITSIIENSKQLTDVVLPNPKNKKEADILQFCYWGAKEQGKNEMAEEEPVYSFQGQNIGNCYVCHFLMPFIVVSYRNGVLLPAMRCMFIFAKIVFVDYYRGIVGGIGHFMKKGLELADFVFKDINQTMLAHIFTDTHRSSFFGKMFNIGMTKGFAERNIMDMLVYFALREYILYDYKLQFSWEQAGFLAAAMVHYGWLEAPRPPLMFNSIQAMKTDRVFFDAPWLVKEKYKVQPVGIATAQTRKRECVSVLLENEHKPASFASADALNDSIYRINLEPVINANCGIRNTFRFHENSYLCMQKDEGQGLETLVQMTNAEHLEIFLMGSDKHKHLSADLAGPQIVSAFLETYLIFIETAFEFCTNSNMREFVTGLLFDQIPLRYEIYTIFDEQPIRNKLNEYMICMTSPEFYLCRFAQQCCEHFQRKSPEFQQAELIYKNSLDKPVAFSPMKFVADCIDWMASEQSGDSRRFIFALALLFQIGVEMDRQFRGADSYQNAFAKRLINSIEHVVKFINLQGLDRELYDACEQDAQKSYKAQIGEIILAARKLSYLDEAWSGEDLFFVKNSCFTEYVFQTAFREAGEYASRQSKREWFGGKWNIPPRLYRMGFACILHSFLRIAANSRWMELQHSAGFVRIPRGFARLLRVDENDRVVKIQTACSFSEPLFFMDTLINPEERSTILKKKHEYASNCTFGNLMNWCLAKQTQAMSAQLQSCLGGQKQDNEQQGSMTMVVFPMQAMAAKLCESLLASETMFCRRAERQFNVAHYYVEPSSGLLTSAGARSSFLAMMSFASQQVEASLSCEWLLTKQKVAKDPLVFQSGPNFALEVSKILDRISARGHLLNRGCTAQKHFFAEISKPNRRLRAILLNVARSNQNGTCFTGLFADIQYVNPQKVGECISIDQPADVFCKFVTDYEAPVKNKGSGSGNGPLMNRVVFTNVQLRTCISVQNSSKQYLFHPFVWGSSPKPFIDAIFAQMSLLRSEIIQASVAGSASDGNLEECIRQFQNGFMFLVLFEADKIIAQRFESISFRQALESGIFAKAASSQKDERADTIIAILVIQYIMENKIFKKTNSYREILTDLVAIQPGKRQKTTYIIINYFVTLRHIACLPQVYQYVRWIMQCFPSAFLSNAHQFSIIRKTQMPSANFKFVEQARKSEICFDEANKLQKFVYAQDGTISAMPIKAYLINGKSKRISDFWGKFKKVDFSAEKCNLLQFLLGTEVFFDVFKKREKHDGDEVKKGAPQQQQQRPQSSNNLFALVYLGGGEALKLKLYRIYKEGETDKDKFLYMIDFDRRMYQDLLYFAHQTNAVFLYVYLQSIKNIWSEQFSQQEFRPATLQKFKELAYLRECQFMVVMQNDKKKTLQHTFVFLLQAAYDKYNAVVGANFGRVRTLIPTPHQIKAVDRIVECIPAKPFRKNYFQIQTGMGKTEFMMYEAMLLAGQKGKNAKKPEDAFLIFNFVICTFLSNNKEQIASRIYKNFPLSTEYGGFIVIKADFQQRIAEIKQAIEINLSIFDANQYFSPRLSEFVLGRKIIQIHEYNEMLMDFENYVGLFKPRIHFPSAEFNSLKSAKQTRAFTQFVLDEFDSAFAKMQQIKQVQQSSNNGGREDVQQMLDNADLHKFGTDLVDVFAKLPAKKEQEDEDKEKDIREVLADDISWLMEKQAYEMVPQLRGLMKISAQFLESFGQMDMGIQIGRIGTAKFVEQCRKDPDGDLMNSQFARTNMMYELAPRENGNLLCDSYFSVFLQRMIFLMYYYVRIKEQVFRLQDVAGEAGLVDITKVLNTLKKSKSIENYYNAVSEKVDRINLGMFVIQFVREIISTPKKCSLKIKLGLDDMKSLFFRRAKAQIQKYNTSTKQTKNIYDFLCWLARGHEDTSVFAFSGTAYQIQFGLYSETNIELCNLFLLSEILPERTAYCQSVFFQDFDPQASGTGEQVKQYYEQCQAALDEELKRGYLTNTWAIIVDEELYTKNMQVEDNNVEAFFGQIFGSAAKKLRTYPNNLMKHRSVDFITDPNGILYNVGQPELRKRLAAFCASQDCPDEFRYTEIYLIDDVIRDGLTGPDFPEKSCVIFGVGRTIGIDVQFLQDQNRCVFTLGKNDKMQKNTNDNQTTFKSRTQADGRARFCRSGIWCFFVTVGSAIKEYQTPPPPANSCRVLVVSNSLAPKVPQIPQEYGRDAQEIKQELARRVKYIILPPEMQQGKAVFADSVGKELYARLFEISAEEIEANFKFGIIMLADYYMLVRNGLVNFKQDTMINLWDFHVVQKVLIEYQKAFMEDCVFLSYYLQAFIRVPGFWTEVFDYIDHSFFCNFISFNGEIDYAERFFYNILNVNYRWSEATNTRARQCLRKIFQLVFGNKAQIDGGKSLQLQERENIRDNALTTVAQKQMQHGKVEEHPKIDNHRLLEFSEKGDAQFAAKVDYKMQESRKAIINKSLGDISNIVTELKNLTTSIYDSVTTGNITVDADQKKIPMLFRLFGDKYKQYKEKMQQTKQPTHAPSQQMMMAENKKYAKPQQRQKKHYLLLTAGAAIALTAAGIAIAKKI